MRTKEEILKEIEKYKFLLEKEEKELETASNPIDVKIIRGGIGAWTRTIKELEKELESLPKETSSSPVLKEHNEQISLRVKRFDEYIKSTVKKTNFQNNMNPIEQIKQEIAALQKKVAELEKQPEELTRETGMSKVNGDYYYINSDGDSVLTDAPLLSDYDRLNVFKTSEEAEAERDYILASRRVRAWAKAVNGEWKADWTNESVKKWGVIIAGTDCDENDIYEIDLVVDYFFTDNSFIHQISFPTEKLAEKFLELFRAELEILAKP